MSLWEHFNNLKFDNKLTKPIIRFTKDTGENFRVRGNYWPGRNMFGFNRRLVNAPYEKFKQIFLHEMCHQAVHVISRADETDWVQLLGGKRDPHGPKWQDWMIKIGLNPSRLDHTKNEEYMHEEEKEINKEKKNDYNDNIATAVRTSPRENKPIRWYDTTNKKWHVGFIVCPNDAQAKRWVVIEDMNSSRYFMVPPSFMYELESEKDKHTMTNPKWKQTAENLKYSLEQHKDFKKSAKEVKKMMREGLY